MTGVHRLRHYRRKTPGCVWKAASRRTIPSNIRNAQIRVLFAELGSLHSFRSCFHSTATRGNIQIRDRSGQFVQ